MKNLFSFATKELSQDALLCWLLENFDDPIVGIATKQLIKNLASLYDNQPIDVNKITKVKTYTQYKHIDVIADVYVNDEIYSFVIEDKTGSKHHDEQLMRYNNEINKWDVKYKYRIFYKTEIIEGYEEECVKKAEWKLFNINKIYNTFKNFKNCGNSILSDYSDYIENKYNEVNFISDKSTNLWNNNNWRTYFKLELEPKIKNKFINQIKPYILEYHGGIYISLCLYYPYYIFDKCKPLIELMFREGDSIHANIRVETKNVDDTWDLKYIDERLNELCKIKIMNNELPSFKYSKTKKSIAVIKRNIKKTNKQDITNNIINIVEEFYNFFKSIK